MARESLLRVLGAGRVETARRWEDRPHEPAIGQDQGPQAASDHSESLESKRDSCVLMERDALMPYGGRTRTSSAPSFSRWSRNASRMRRLIALRSEASRAWRRVTIMPRRAAPRSRLSTKKVYPSRLRRAPLRSRRSKSALLRSLRPAPRPNRLPAATTVPAGAGPSHDGCAALRARHASGRERGSRGAVRGAFSRVGTCASLPSLPDPKKGGIRACVSLHCQIHPRTARAVGSCG
jgi:hypothetical protein